MKLIQLMIIGFILPQMIYAQEAINEHHHAKNRPDAHAPIGVMLDHMHKKGEWMVSYRYMTMSMKNNYTGSKKIGDDQVLDQYMVAPVSMKMNMHMFGLMYAPSDHVTMMVMLPYASKTMDHITRMGQEFTTDAKSIGDISVAGMIRLFANSKSKMHINAGLKIPTGKVDSRGSTPMGEGQKLPYAMQIGSGTLDWILGGTYVLKGNHLSGGLQLNTLIRSGENDQGYRFGNKTNFTGWLAFAFSEYISPSIRLNAIWEGDISGADSELNPMMVQTANPSNYGGNRIEGAIGVNLQSPDSFIKGARLAAEWATPLYQNVNGTQLGINSSLTLGLQYAF